MKNRLLLIISIFTFICFLLLALIVIEAKILSGVRSYVRGEGLYAKGQKDAIISLVKFVRSKDVKDFQLYEEKIQIPVGDRIAREALQKDIPDRVVAMEGFLKGENISSDIPMMINLFIYFNQLPFMKKAISIWTEGDQEILKLNECAYKLKSAVLNGDDKKANEYLDEIDILNNKLANLELDFSLTIGDGANLVTQILLISSFCFSSLVFFVVFFYIKNIVSVVVKIENDLKEKQIELKNEVDTKDRFFSIIAHDLNNPFNLLLGMTEIMLTDAERFTKQEIVDLAKKVYDHAYRVFCLQKDLLEWSRTQFQKGEVIKQKVSLRELTKSTVRIFESLCSHKEIALLNESEDYMVYIDPDMIQTVLRNLISNAIKFTPRKGEISLFTKKQEDYIQISVCDSGVGMSEDQMSKIFDLDKVSSTVGTEGERGTGLGMPLCKEMVEKNGGKIWVESSTGNGSTFHFTVLLAK